MDSEQARHDLEDERGRLRGLRDGLVDSGAAPSPDRSELPEQGSLEQHQADAGTETFDRERDLSILEQIEAELADVEHALERLDEGTYGTCEACGGPIDDERLQVRPEARFCVRDQTAAEREAHSR